MTTRQITSFVTDQETIISYDAFRYESYLPAFGQQNLLTFDQQNLGLTRAIYQHLVNKNYQHLINKI